MTQARLVVRTRRWLLAAPLLVIAACLAGDRSDVLGPSFAISDASHSGGTPGFFFLPPMVSQPTVTGTFDGDIAAVNPAVVICEMTVADCGAATALRVFTPSSTPAITVTADKYAVKWDTREANFLAGHTYRVHVLAGTGAARRRLGFADILLSTEPGKAKNFADGQTIVLADGRTLPIHFRIERGVVGRSALTCDVDRVARLINSLVPADTRRGAAHASFAAIRSSINSGNPKAAVSAMFAFLRQILGYFGAGTLLDPTAPLGLSTGEATGELGSQLYACAGLTGQAPLTLGQALESGGVAEVVEGPSDVTQVVVTPDGLAGASFPPGALDQTVLVTITPDPDGLLPFPSTLDQYQPFYDFSIFPEVQFPEEFPVTVGICIDSDVLPEDRQDRYDFLQLAHPDPATGRTTIEILTKVAAPPGVCGGGSGLVPPSPASGWRETFARLVLPEPAHATSVLLGGVGGKTTTFSPFRAVDPNSRLEFIQQPTSTPAGAIMPEVKVAVQDGTGLTIKSYNGKVAVALANETSATLSGTTFATFVNGVATFGDLSINQAGTYTLFATATSIPEPGTGVRDPTPADRTSDPFDITVGPLATITVTPNPASVSTNAAQQFTAVGKDPSGTVVAITPVWSVVAGGGSINASTGLFTAGAVTGTFINTVRATSGAISGTATVIITAALSGTLSDPVGDASTGPDFTDAYAAVAGGYVTLSARFAGTSFSSATSRVVWSLDTDQNVATGFPGITAGFGDAELIGGDYIVRVLGTEFGSLVQVLHAIGTSVTTVSSGVLMPSYASDGVDVTVPLSLLGSDDGVMNFKATVQTQLTIGSSTAIFDFISDLGVAPGTTVAP